MSFEIRDNVICLSPIKYFVKLRLRRHHLMMEGVAVFLAFVGQFFEGDDIYRGVGHIGPSIYFV